MVGIEKHTPSTTDLHTQRHTDTWVEKTWPCLIKEFNWFLRLIDVRLIVIEIRLLFKSKSCTWKKNKVPPSHPSITMDPNYKKSNKHHFPES